MKFGKTHAQQAAARKARWARRERGRWVFACFPVSVEDGMTYINYGLLAPTQPGLPSLSSPEWGVLDEDFDELDFTQVTAQFASLGGLTAGQRKGYDASWFRVRGDRHTGKGGT